MNAIRTVSMLVAAGLAILGIVWGVSVLSSVPPLYEPRTSAVDYWSLGVTSIASIAAGLWCDRR